MAASGAAVDFPMLPWDIDARLWAGPASAPALPPAAQWELYRQLLYKLFIAEFIAHVNQERDEDTRAALRAALASRHPRAATRKVLAAVAAARPAYAGADADAEALMRYEGRPGELAEAVFGFDRRSLERHQRGDADLAGLMTGLVDVLPAAEIRHRLEGIKDVNIFASCRDRQGRAPCRGDRLMVPREEFADLVALLDADLRNPMSAAVILFAGAGVLDDMDFVRRPGETVFVKF